MKVSHVRLCNTWNSPGQNTGMGSLSFLHGTLPTQGWNPGLLHCRQILYQLKGILQKGSVLNLINYQRPHLLSSIEVRISKYVWGGHKFSVFSPVEADRVSDKICVWHFFFFLVCVVLSNINNAYFGL